MIITSEQQVLLRGPVSLYNPCIMFLYVFFLLSSPSSYHQLHTSRGPGLYARIPNSSLPSPPLLHRRCYSLS